MLWVVGCVVVVGVVGVVDVGGGVCWCCCGVVWYVLCVCVCV